MTCDHWLGTWNQSIQSFDPRPIAHNKCMCEHASWSKHPNQSDVTGSPIKHKQTSGNTGKLISLECYSLRHCLRFSHLSFILSYFPSLLSSGHPSLFQSIHPTLIPFIYSFIPFSLSSLIPYFVLSLSHCLLPSVKKSQSDMTCIFFQICMLKINFCSLRFLRPLKWSVQVRPQVSLSIAQWLYFLRFSFKIIVYGLYVSKP